MPESADYGAPAVLGKHGLLGMCDDGKDGLKV